MTGKVLRHVAIIMDGNGRWATARGLPRAAGHKAGADAVRRTLTAARKLGVEVLTLYAFSTENWKRPQSEINALMDLLRRYLAKETGRLVRESARLRVIGRRDRLPPDLIGMIVDAEDRTAQGTGPTLVLALDYGGQDEIARAAGRMAEAMRAGALPDASVGPDVFSAFLDTAGLPPVDLLVRTGGDQRISNFLPWQAAYAELVFTSVPWPEFEATDLEEAARNFSLRERRFGGLMEA